MAEEVAAEYKTSLDDLTFNSKPVINMLTMVAEDNIDHAQEISEVIEERIMKAPANRKLPVLYLIDSIIKNVRHKRYLDLFSNKIVEVFAAVFRKVDEKTRQALYKLRQTWTPLFENKRLYALDLQIAQIDPAWPITAKNPDTVSIHVNPKFLNPKKPASPSLEEEQKKLQRAKEEQERLRQQKERAEALRKTQEERRKLEEERQKREQENAEVQMREQLLSKQQELIQLQQERLQLELVEAKAKLDHQTRQLQLKEQQMKQQLLAQLQQNASQSQKSEPKAEEPAPAPVSARDPRSRRDPRLVNKDLKSGTPPPSQTAVVHPNKHTQNMTEEDRSTPDRKEPKDKPSVKTKSPTKQPEKKTDSPPKALIKSPLKKVGKNEDKIAIRADSKGDSKNETVEKAEKEKSEQKIPLKDIKSGKVKAPKSDRDSGKKHKEEKEDSEKAPVTRTTRDAVRRSRENKEKGRSSDTANRERTRSERPVRHYRKPHSPSPEADSVPERKRTRGRARSPSITRSRSRSPLFQSRIKGRSTQETRHTAAGNVRDKISDRPRDARSSARVTSQRKGEANRKYGVGRKGAPETGKRGESVEKSDRESGPPKKKVRQADEDVVKEEGQDGVDDQGKLTGELAELFGQEDKDYRQLPPIPKLNTNLPIPDDEQHRGLMSPSAAGWSKFKATHPEEFPFAQPRTNETIHRQASVTRFRTPLQSPPADTDGYSRNLQPDSLDQDPAGSMSMDSAGDILEQAEQQLRTGKLTHMQHQELLHQLTELQNLQKMKQQLREENKMIAEAKPTPENLKTIRTGFLKRSMLGSPPRMSLSPGRDQPSQGSDTLFDREQKFPEEKLHKSSLGPFQGSKFEDFDGMKQKPQFDSRQEHPFDSRQEPPFDSRHQSDFRPPREGMLEDQSGRSGSNMATGDRPELPNMLGNERPPQDHRNLHMPRDPRKPLLDTPGDSHDGPPMFREPRNPPQQEAGLHQSRPGSFQGPSNEPYLGPDPEIQGEQSFRPGRSGQGQHSRPPSGSFSGPPEPLVDHQPEPRQGHAPQHRADRPQGQFQGPDSKFDQPFEEMNEGNSRRKHFRKDRPKMSDPGMGQGMYTKDQRHRPTAKEEIEEASGRPLLRSESFEPLQQPWYDTDLIYCPSHDARWVRRLATDKESDLLYVVIGPNLRLQVPQNFKGRKIKLGRHNEYVLWMEYDHRQRRLYLDNEPFYKIGEEPKLLTLGKGKYEVEYMVHMEGTTKNVWIDEVQYNLHKDAPPELIHFSNRDHRFQIDTLRNMVIVDGHDICPADGPPKKIQLAYVIHTIQFDPPPKHILIDGNLCELDLVARFPLVIINGKPHGIRFDGPPRRVLINDVVHTVHMDRPRKAKISGQKPLLLAFGGPGHEIIIENNWYEVKFGEPPKHIRVGTRMYKIELPGRPPEVKILGEYVPVEQIVSRVGRPEAPLVPQIMPGSQSMPGQPLPGQPMSGAPLPRPLMPGQPMPGQTMPNQQMMMGLQTQMPGPTQFNQPGQGMVPMQGMRPDYVPGGPGPNGMAGQMPGQPPMPGMSQQRPDMMGQQPPQPSVPTSAPINVNDLLSKLVSAGVIANTSNTNSRATPPPSESAADEIEQEMVLRESVQEIPELISFKPDLLKKRYVGARQLLSVGIQCASCGLRFVPEHKEQYKEHLDWHFRQNKRGKDEMKVAKHRHWYYSVSDWIQYEEIGDLEQRQQSSFFEQTIQTAVQTGQRNLPGQGDVISCPAVSGEDDDVCGICGEAFEQFWDEDEEEWHLKDAIRAKNGKTYHPVCYEDVNESNTSLMETESPDIPSSQQPPSFPAEGSTSPKSEPVSNVGAEVEAPSTDVVTPASVSGGADEYVPEAPPQLMDMINNPLGYLTSLSKQMKRTSSAASLTTRTSAEQAKPVLSGPASLTTRTSAEQAKPVLSGPASLTTRTGAEQAKPVSSGPTVTQSSISTQVRESSPVTNAKPATVTVINPVLSTTTSEASANPPRVITPPMLTPNPPVTVASGGPPHHLPRHTSLPGLDTPPHQPQGQPRSGGGTPVRDEMELPSGGCTPLHDEPVVESGRGTPVEDEPPEPMDVRMQVGSLYPAAASLVHVITPMSAGGSQHQDPALTGIKQEVMEDGHLQRSPRS